MQGLIVSPTLKISEAEIRHEFGEWLVKQQTSFSFGRISSLVEEYPVVLLSEKINSSCLRCY